YHYRWNSDLKSVFEIIVKTPIHFQNWVSEKDLGIKDLVVLKLAPVPALFLERITFCSRQLGCKILEWGIELSAQYSFERILENSENSEQWYANLFKLKYPMATARDQDYINRVVSTPWPRQIDAQWKRVGDKAGVEVRFTTLSAADFQQKS